MRRFPRPSWLAAALGVVLVACGSGGSVGSGRDVAPRARPLHDALRSPYGVNVHAPSGRHAAQLLDRVAGAGVGWIRIDLGWDHVERRAGRYDWSLHDELVRTARRRGLEVLALAAYTPAWATSGPPRAGVPRDPEAFGRFCRAAAERYRGEVRAWEVWNEPNNPRFWRGSPEEYRDRVLVPCAEAIHGTDPRALVAGPALAHLESRSWRRWLAVTLEAAGDHLDVVTHHLYGDTPREVGEDLSDVYRVVARADQAAKPFWLTETGWRGGRGREEAQAEAYRAFLDDWRGSARGREWIDKVFFYELQDDPRADPWGLLRSDGRPKPAWEVLASFARREG